MARAYHYFHTDEDSTGTGTVYNNAKATREIGYTLYPGEDTMNIEFTATSTFSATIETNNGLQWLTLMVFDITACDVVAAVTDATHRYQIDLTGLSQVRVNLTANAGTVNCAGWVA